MFYKMVLEVLNERQRRMLVFGRLELEWCERKILLG